MTYAPDVVVRFISMGSNYVWRPLTQRGREALNLTSGEQEYWCPKATSDLLFDLLHFEIIIIGDVVVEFCAFSPTDDCVSFVGVVA